MLRRIVPASVVAIAITLVTAAFAFADHSPAFHVEWDADSTHSGYGASFGNTGTGSPHQNYLEGTEKCGVCHAVHRAPVPGVRWDTNPNDVAAKTPVAGRQYFRAEFESDSVGNTQMLLMSDVADSCTFCHVDTAIGNKQLYAGDSAYISALDDDGTDEWDIGFGHGNPCVSCHAVHGAADNDGNPVLYGRYGTFEGPLRPKVLKVRVKNYAKIWQDEVYVSGSKGKHDAEDLFGVDWASRLTVDDAAVDPLNIPLFPSSSDAIEGRNTRPDESTYDAQVTVFCTFCHQMYGWASEATVNPDADYGPLRGPWDGLADAPEPSDEDPVPGMYVFPWSSVMSEEVTFCAHPIKSAENTPVVGGMNPEIVGPIAFSGAEGCHSCHDAGVRNATGVIVQSWPHFTPGYFHFTKVAESVGASAALVPPIADFLSSTDTTAIATTKAWLNDPQNYKDTLKMPLDGMCLKCHVNGTKDAGVGITF